jgi:hypothetical protein
MLALTAMQIKKLRELEESSFRQYCVRCGYNECEHAALLLSFAKQRVDAVIGSTSIDNVPDEQVRSLIRRMQDAENIFDLHHAESETRRLKNAILVSQLANELPISDDYVTGLCQRLGLVPPKTGLKDSVKALLEAVPIVSRWNLEFNAFATEFSLVDDDVPCVCIDQTLLSACNSFVRCTAPAALQFDGAVGARSPDRARESGSDPVFMERLQSVLLLALGRSNYSLSADVVNSRKTESTISLMVEGCVQAVWMHELGHLLRGHLEQDQSHSIEYEADQFAFSILLAQTSNESLNLWLTLGGIAMIVLIDIVEKIGRVTDSDSHPPGNRRIDAALNFLRKKNPRVGTAASRYVRSLAAACDPTLLKNWDVEPS